MCSILNIVMYMKVCFLDIDKKKLKNIKEDTRYVIITNNDLDNINEYNIFEFKPIIIAYNGSYVIDLANNSVIIKKPISEYCLNKVLDYTNTHDVNTKLYQNNKDLFEIKLETRNRNRMMVIPKLFKDKIPNVKSVGDLETIYVTNSNASIINAIGEVLSYLNINEDIIGLDNIYNNININGTLLASY